MQAFSHLLAVRRQLLSSVVFDRRLLALAALASLSIGASARAEQASPPGLSAESFLARVGTSHLSLPLLEAAVDEAAANVKTTGLWANPALSYDREEVFAGGSGQPENLVRLELPVEISGRRRLRVEGAEFGLQAARAASTRDRAALLFEALGIYWRAASSRQSLELLRRERDALGRLARAVRSRTAAGDTSGYDLDRLELEVESLEDFITEADRELDGWRLRLGMLVGAPATRLEASDSLALPGQPLPLAGLLQEIISTRADYQAARLRVAQAEREIAAAERGWVPTVVLSGGAKNAESQGETAWGYTAGLALSLPVFDHGQGEAARSRARLRQAQAEQRLIEAQAPTELASAHAALTRSLAQAVHFETTQLPRLERLVHRAEVSYQEGERPVFELLDAHRTARAIRLRQIELRHEARQAELDLARAAGQLPGVAK